MKTLEQPKCRPVFGKCPHLVPPKSPPYLVSHPTAPIWYYQSPHLVCPELLLCICLNPLLVMPKPPSGTCQSPHLASPELLLCICLNPLLVMPKPPSGTCQSPHLVLAKVPIWYLSHASICIAQTLSLVSPPPPI